MKKILIYLDNCCFNRPYDNQTQERIYLESMAKMYIQQLIVDKLEETEIIRLANEIMQKGIKEKDALHIACAIYSDCDYFITTDDRLLRFHTVKIKIQDPMQFIRETEVKFDE